MKTLLSFFNYLPFSQVFILLLFNSTCILIHFWQQFYYFHFWFLLTTLSKRVKMQVNAQNGGHWAAVKNVNEISNFSVHFSPFLLFCVLKIFALPAIILLNCCF